MQRQIAEGQLSLCPYSQLCNESHNGYNLWYPKKKKKILIQSQLKYPMVWERSIPMVWERSNKRDWDLHLKAGLFRSLYLCTHCHCLPDVSTNQLPLPSRCFDQSVYIPIETHLICKIWKTKTIMGLIFRVKYFSINGFMTCKIIFVTFFLLKKCLDTILITT